MGAIGKLAKNLIASVFVAATPDGPYSAAADAGLSRVLDSNVRNSGHNSRSPQSTSGEK
jgi:hypothetical protein